MSQVSLIERLTALDKPDERHDAEQIWITVRSLLGFLE